MKYEIKLIIYVAKCKIQQEIYLSFSQAIKGNSLETTQILK